MSHFLKALSACLLLAGCHAVSPGSTPPADLAPSERVQEIAPILETAKNPEPPEPGGEGLDALARSAILKSLPFLEAEGTAWMRGEVSVQSGKGCVSCHHVNYAVWSLHEAQRIGLETPGGGIEELTAAAFEFASRPDKARSMSIGPMLLGVTESHHQNHSVLKTRLLNLQTSSGRWRARGQFPSQRRPIAESDAVATMWSLLILPTEALADSQNADIAMEWLEQEEPGVSHEWIAGAMLLAHASGRLEDLAASRATLLAGQNDDGGWGWLTGDGSNAFSTGQALYALARIGEQPNQSAQRFLIEDQGEDGIWRVPSAAISNEPSAKGDLIYRFWGSAWATIGLARSVASLQASDDLAEQDLGTESGQVESMSG